MKRIFDTASLCCNSKNCSAGRGPVYSINSMLRAVNSMLLSISSHFMSISFLLSLGFFPYFLDFPMLWRVSALPCSSDGNIVATHRGAWRKEIVVGNVTVQRGSVLPFVLCRITYIYIYLHITFYGLMFNACFSESSTPSASHRGRRAGIIRRRWATGMMNFIERRRPRAGTRGWAGSPSL